MRRRLGEGGGREKGEGWREGGVILSTAWRAVVDARTPTVNAPANMRELRGGAPSLTLALSPLGSLSLSLSLPLFFPG